MKDWKQLKHSDTRFEQARKKSLEPNWLDESEDWRLQKVNEQWNSVEKVCLFNDSNNEIVLMAFEFSKFFVCKIVPSFKGVLSVSLFYAYEFYSEITIPFHCLHKNLTNDREKYDFEHFQLKL